MWKLFWIFLCWPTSFKLATSVRLQCLARKHFWIHLESIQPNKKQRTFPHAGSSTSSNPRSLYDVPPPPKWAQSIQTENGWIDNYTSRTLRPSLDTVGGELLLVIGLSIIDFAVAIVQRWALVGFFPISSVSSKCVSLSAWGRNFYTAVVDFCYQGQIWMIQPFSFNWQLNLPAPVFKGKGWPFAHPSSFGAFIIND